MLVKSSVQRMRSRSAFLDPSAREFRVHHDIVSDVSWLALDFHYTMSRYDKPAYRELGNEMPLVVTMNDMDKSKNRKRGDFYHFSSYRPFCHSHEWCDLPIGVPFFMQHRDVGLPDLSRLIEKGSLISSIIAQSEIPSELKDSWLVKALASNTLTEAMASDAEHIQAFLRRYQLPS